MYERRKGEVQATTPIIISTKILLPVPFALLLPKLPLFSYFKVAVIVLQILEGLSSAANKTTKCPNYCTPTNVVLQFLPQIPIVAYHL